MITVTLRNAFPCQVKMTQEYQFSIIYVHQTLKMWVPPPAEKQQMNKKGIIAKMKPVLNGHYLDYESATVNWRLHASSLGGGYCDSP